MILLAIFLLNGCSKDEQENVEISVLKNDGGTTTPERMNVKKNATASFNIKPSENYYVASVSGCDGVYTDGLYEVNKVSRNCSVNVQFEKKRYILMAMQNEGGEIVPNSREVQHDMSTEFTITPQAGYEINTVKGCSGELTGNKYVISNVTEHCIVHADFQKVSYVVSTESNGEGKLTPEMQIGNLGDILNFKAVAQEGYELSNISGCNGKLEAEGYFTAPVTSDCEVVADFTPKIFTITTNVNEAGSIVPLYAEVKFGQSQVFDISVEKGFKLIDVQGCNGILEGAKFHVENVSEHCEIQVKIEKQGRLMISFDDIYADEWLFNAQPIFDLYNMKAIYYINPVLLERRGYKDYVEQLYKKGNIIGHHSCTHQFAVGYKGDYVKAEVLKCIDFFKDYNLKHFAYPYGWGPESTTTELLQTFNTVRNFAVKWPEAAFDPLKAMSIDGAGRLSWEAVWKALDKAKAEDLTLHLATHRVIEDCEAAQNGWSICKDELQSLLQYADAIGLELGPDSSW